MRDSASASAPISSRLFASKSSACTSPRLILSASAEICVTGRMNMRQISRFSMAPMASSTPSSEAMRRRSAASARAWAAASGTCTICAPMTSPTFQPNPAAEPYCAIIVRGARSAVSWQRMQAAVAFKGLAMNSMRPLGVSRCPNSGTGVVPLRNPPTMSCSQSTALLAGLVGFSVASR
jgi:hypothetical protein